ncbi:MAG: radical SAM protein [Bacteroidetes bacterium]|nr:radical SAM protein [Bacteroidota bacterium]MBU1113525.1 radical SAM protein [Bacteroidota bacterium]MBU1797473.1 radical SAM protein [Bacteroidota bacterium]
MQSTLTYSNIPIFIPELACPHQCVFCDQAKIIGLNTIPKPNEISKIVETNLTTMDENRIIDIAFFGGSFTGIPFELQEEYLKEAFSFIKANRISGIRLSTRPDYIDVQRLELLKKYGVTTIELGAQSTNDNVLIKSGRGHSFKDIQNASKLILDYGFKLGLQMMIGLPGDTFETAMQTANDIIELGANNTRIYPTLVIKGTALEKLYNNGIYQPLSLEVAVNWSKEILRTFEKNNITILRVGLHPSEELVDGKSLIAGPFHPSFKEMVMTEIWNDIILGNLNQAKSKNLIIKVNSKQLNYAVGYKGKNKNQLLAKGIKVKFVGDSSFEKYQINVSNN